jgi:hypothetical protein
MPGLYRLGPGIRLERKGRADTAALISLPGVSANGMTATQKTVAPAGRFVVSHDVNQQVVGRGPFKRQFDVYSKIT